jgi:hypothetical protein
MMQETKIQLLPFEIELVSDTAFILTKNAILKKINFFLSSIEERQKEILKNHPDVLPVEIVNNSSKISRGENYKGLPWLVLDHPRYFEKNNVIAIRTMFWWGNFFSVTLQLSGKTKEQFQEKILQNISMLHLQDFCICINENEWEHHFGSENYKKLNELTKAEIEKIIINKPFLKLAISFPVHQFDKMEENLYRSFELLIRLFL